MKTEDEAKICKDFGKNLAFIRRTLSWTQEKLALESGLAKSYVGEVERGVRNISLINIVKIANTLGIDAYKLLMF